MIYNHVPNRGGNGVKSPADDLLRRDGGVLYGNHISPRDSCGRQPDALWIQARDARMVAAEFYAAMSRPRCNEEII